MVYNGSMGKITDITKQKNGKRANIFIDGAYVCGLELITVAGAHLKIGGEIDTETLAELQKASESEKAFDKAVNYISTRRRTEREVRRKLQEKGYLPEVTEGVVGKLRSYGYIDDRKFCEEYAELYGKTYGTRRIRAQLRELGVDGELVSEVLEETIDEETQAEAACEAARKYLRCHDYDRTKLMRHLSAKGFGYGDIAEAINTVVGENPDED